MKLLDGGESESEYQASAYEYDTGTESVASSVKSSSSSKVRKSFKPSAKKKIQLTFENLSVSTVARRKKLLCFNYGQASYPKTILDNVTGTITPG